LANCGDDTVIDDLFKMGQCGRQDFGRVLTSVTLHFSPQPSAPLAGASAARPIALRNRLPGQGRPAGFLHTFDPCAPFVIGGVESGHQSSSILQGLGRQGMRKHSIKVPPRRLI
jgi:hypothetical protein